jgi:Bacterial regulatory proteins, luxR family
MKTQPLTTTNFNIQTQLTAQYGFGFVPNKQNTIYFKLDLSECRSYSQWPDKKLLITIFPQFFTGGINGMLDFNEPTNIASFQTILYHLQSKDFTKTGDLSFVGLDFKISGSEKVRKLFLHITPTVNQNDRGKTCFDVVAHDISHLFKADFYWLRNSSLVLPSYCFHSQSQKEDNRCIVSDREMAVVQGVVSGLNSGQIADKLFISTITVNNHKQKILKRTGTCDLVAMVQICKLAKIIY